MNLRLISTKTELLSLPADPKELVRVFNELFDVELVPFINNARQFCSDITEKNQTQLLFQFNLLLHPHNKELILGQTFFNDSFFDRHFPQKSERFRFLARWFNQDIFGSWLEGNSWREFNVYNPTENGSKFFKNIVGGFKTRYIGEHEVLTRML